MPTRAPRRCTTTGCRGVPGPQGGKCPGCRARTGRASDQRRGSPTERGYGREHRDVFRPGVLARDPVCVLCGVRPSVVADHWPLDRKQLVARGLNPNDPVHGRGLCEPCDRVDKADRQPGGWNKRRRQ
ncbi:holin [Micromonospora craterilacus]|uniref:Holin n=1 Tax=Micromonospora craterilacus TaxID=1655439 RepID=A0A2W2EGT1_9ACTN|nr:holin [Micromonospora craterilacus]